MLWDDHRLAHRCSLIHLGLDIEVRRVGEHIPHLVSVVATGVVSDDVLLEHFKLLLLQLPHIPHLQHVHPLDLKDTTLAVLRVRLFLRALITLELQRVHGRPLVPIVVLTARPSFTNHLERRISPIVVEPIVLRAVVILLADLHYWRPVVPVMILAARPIGAHDQLAFRLFLHFFEVTEVLIFVDETVGARADHTETRLPGIPVLFDHVGGPKLEPLVHLGRNRANLLE